MNALAMYQAPVRLGNKDSRSGGVRRAVAGSGGRSRLEGGVMAIRRRTIANGTVTAVMAAVTLGSTSLAGPAPAIAQLDVAAAAVKVPVATGYGGAVATVDLDASRAALEVLRSGGNAADAAVAAAAMIGVTEPYSGGLGGGGFFVHYDARTGVVSTVDGRETAPARMRADSFIDPVTGQPIPFGEAVTSGLSVGVPGTPRTWQRALDTWGSRSLRHVLRPAIEVAERGFVVDQTFHDQTVANLDRFNDIVPTRELFLPNGQAPPVGSTLRNHDLAQTYRLIAKHGVGVLYDGPIAEEIVDTVQHPPVDPAATRVVRPGLMELGDLRAYRVLDREPTVVSYRGLDVYGMAPPSSGGSTVGEALNILEAVGVPAADPVQALHHYLEASRLSFADRNRYVGDPAYVDVPLGELLSQGFAGERACLIDPDTAAPGAVPPGSPDGSYAPCGASGVGASAAPYEGPSTTHLVTADRWGNVVAYNLTIEQTGGSGIVVPGRGFLLNNELTDFSFAPPASGLPDPNLPAGGKRPRSSMAPTIVLHDGAPVLAVGSPGGAAIITTVLQILLNRLDLGMTLPDAIAAPRASQRNGATTQAEPLFLTAYEAALKAKGHSFVSVAELGAATGLEFLGDGLVRAAAEPTRRGGGSALVLRPAG
jgi:gamma-glutamyltranspeptidase / glutathione hydrolase